MGIVFKLKPEIREFILAKKKEDPSLSCRKVNLLVEGKFALKVSKSSINTIFKEAGLSMPVGRRLEKKRRPALKLKINFPDLLQLTVKPEEIIRPQEEAPQPAQEQPPEQVEKPQIVEQQEVIEIPKPQEPIPAAAPIITDEPKIEPSIPAPSVEIASKVTHEEVAETQTTGAIILKAADYLLGGIDKINEVIGARLGAVSPDYALKTEALIYSLLLDSEDKIKFAPDSPLWPLIGAKFTPDIISAYFTELQRVTTLSSDIAQGIETLFVDVRGIKIDLVDGDSLYLDGQFKTIWSIPHLPNYFSGTISKIKSCVNKYFRERSPFILFTAPGHDSPSSEFFDFLFSLDTPDKKYIRSFSLYDNQFKELCRIPIELAKKENFIFGLWPWQFVQSRKVNKIKEFRQFYFEPLKREYFIAEIEVSLSQPNIKKDITLRGCAIKTNLNEKIRLVVLSNYTAEELDLEFLCSNYLSNWPNMEEGFQDYNHKIEISTYALSAASQEIFDTQELLKHPILEISVYFKNYLKTLDLFARKRFLPLGYENNDFSTVKERFYDIAASITRGKDYCSVLFTPPEQYAFINDLKYICSRLNERNIISGDGKKYWFGC